MRCIKPNASQRSGLFDPNFVSSQLISSGSIAYQKLMKTGFPAHISIEDLFNKFKSNGDFKKYTSLNQKDFCYRLLRACYLEQKDFAIGNTKIFFRNGKLEKFNDKLKCEHEDILFRLNKLKMLRSKLNIAIIVARFLSIGKRREIDPELDLESATKQSGEIQCSESVAGKRKRMKFDTQTDQCNASLKRIIGISSMFRFRNFQCSFFHKAHFIIHIYSNYLFV